MEPAEVTFVPQVEKYVQAMQRIKNLPSPLMVLLRPILSPIWSDYDFGHASAEECYGKFQPITQLLRIRIGFCCTKSSEKTSNKREFHTLCNHVKDKAEGWRFTNHEVWIGTDSKVSHKIWYKCGSTDKELYVIILDI